MIALDPLRKIARDFDVPHRDVVLLSLATHGRFGRLTPENKARVADAGLRIFKQLGSEAARVCYLKIRDTQVAPHLQAAA